MADEVNMNETTDVSIEDLKAQIEQLQADNEKLKRATTNASADASKYKKELQSRMSEQERKDAEEAEEKRRLLERLEELETASRNERGKAGFIGLGFADSAAKDATEAFYRGDIDAFATLFRNFLTDHDKALKAESVRNTTPPFGGSSIQQTVTKEQFDKMSYRELNELFTKDPELYNKLKTS